MLHATRFLPNQSSKKNVQRHLTNRYHKPHWQNGTLHLPKLAYYVSLS